MCAGLSCRDSVLVRVVRGGGRLAPPRPANGLDERPAPLGAAAVAEVLANGRVEATWGREGAIGVPPTTPLPEELLELTAAGDSTSLPEGVPGVHSRAAGRAGRPGVDPEVVETSSVVSDISEGNQAFVQRWRHYATGQTCLPSARGGALHYRRYG